MRLLLPKGKKKLLMLKPSPLPTGYHWSASVKGPLTIVYVPEKFDFSQAITSSAAKYSLIAEMQT